MVSLWQSGGVTRRWWLLPLLIVLVVGAGAAAGYGLRQVPAQTGGDEEETPPAPAMTTTAAPGAVPGSPTVELAEGAKADPASADIQNLLQRHFEAINHRDYQAWQTTVTRQRAAEFSSEQQWLDDYQSTVDSAIRVDRIEPTTTGSVVLISFTSAQDPTLAPDDQQSDCLRWRVGYLVVTVRRELRLGHSDGDTSQHFQCNS